MADEAVALEEETETSVLDVLATQSEEVEEELPVDVEDESDDIEVYKKRLKERNHRLKLAKDANTRLLEEQEDFKSRLDEMEAKLAKPVEDAGAKNQEQSEALDRWRTEISDNPEKAVDFNMWQMNNLQQTVVDVVTGMKNSFDSQIAELKGATNPERIKYSEDLKRFRGAFPELENVDDDSAIEIVKSMKGRKIPRGSIAGGKVSKQPTNNDVVESLKKQFADSFANG